MADAPTTRTYPHGVPSWIDLETHEVDAALAFYGELLGWRFTEKVPPAAPGRYVVASRDGTDATSIAAIATPDPGFDGEVMWHTYLAVDDITATAERVTALGGVVSSPPEPVGPPGGPAAGQMARIADPQGAPSRLWQAGTRPGAQAVNAPGTWNFSSLLTPDVDQALRFYGPLFGWERSDDLGAGMARVPGYGDHLARTVDPAIHERQEHVPPGFADVVAGIAPAAGPARWSVAFAVADRDESAATAERGGATVLATEDSEWTKEATIRDPFGAELVLSQFAPPAEFLEAEAQAGQA
ncbi:VOC family protein [Myceligenerans pegani]|uniref:VOC family protein n=1 Tax=Myceligenerans pegani TaxID=2776917 RepID=A0ABR9MY59_9MICO|nr:VOC family protein [Myceligenerans sp. TRM 65318]MBE1876304.1 VOC family protein [Myceligenerans sp. TRM 65318]MBE3018575.1 VOC family protein [Myceligenerans sp. TRM 65318]